MSFSTDFCLGIIICDDCKNPIMTHVDLLLNKKPEENSLSLLNKECFETTKAFLRSGYMARCHSDIGKARCLVYTDDEEDEYVDEE
jgi:hypothetical protein